MMKISKRFYSMLAVVLCVATACDDDIVDPNPVPDDIRTAASVVNVGGVNLTVTASAGRPAGSASTQWLVQVRPPAGMALPDMAVVELWYVDGSDGDLAAITQVGVVRTDPANPYFEVRARGGDFQVGDNVDVAITIFDRVSARRYARASVQVQAAAP
jgi:hypothetical protein